MPLQKALLAYSGASISWIFDNGPKTNLGWINTSLKFLEFAEGWNFDISPEDCFEQKVICVKIRTESIGGGNKTS